MAIPVLVVAGFLGSGKTSLLNHLLHAPDGPRIGVIVNDFGRVNIDAMAVAGQVDAMITLGNGCLCCAVDASDLTEMLERLAVPGGPVDVIVIEASGLAEPPAMVRMVLAGDNPRLTYGGLIEVVDAAEFHDTRERHPQIDKHLRYADLVLLNKVDRAEHPDELLDLVRHLTGGVPVVPTEHGRVDPRMLFDPVQRPRSGQMSFDDLVEHDQHIHAGYDSLTYTTSTALHPVRFAQFLAERPDGLYRLKGYADFGTDSRFGVQTVGGHIAVTEDRWPIDARTTELVLIGAPLDTDTLTKALRDTEEPDRASITTTDLASMTRHIAPN